MQVTRREIQRRVWWRLPPGLRGMLLVVDPNGDELARSLHRRLKPDIAQPQPSGAVRQGVPRRFECRLASAQESAHLLRQSRHAAARSTMSLSSTRPIRVRPACVKVASFTALLLIGRLYAPPPRVVPPYSVPQGLSSPGPSSGGLSRVLRREMCLDPHSLYGYHAAASHIIELAGLV